MPDPPWLGLKFPSVHKFDCEDPRDLAQLENPILTLEPLEGLIILDEIQRRPELFPVLRVLIDKKPNGCSGALIKFCTFDNKLTIIPEVIKK